MCRLTPQTSHRPDPSSGWGWAEEGLEEEEEEGEGRVFPTEAANYEARSGVAKRVSHRH